MNVAISKRTGDNSVTWFGADNSDAISESIGTIGQVTMLPKTVGAYTKFSHLMGLHSKPKSIMLLEMALLRSFQTLVMRQN